MKTKMKAVMTGALYFFLFFLLIGYISGQTARGKARQTGVVLDHGGNPVVGAKVTLEYLGPSDADTHHRPNLSGSRARLSNILLSMMNRRRAL